MRNPIPCPLSQPTFGLFPEKASRWALRPAAYTFLLCAATCTLAHAQEPPADALRETDQVPFDKLPSQRPTTSQEMLNLFDISAERLATLIDGEPFGASDEDLVLKILYRSPQFPLQDVERWTRDDVPCDAIVKQPDDYRADVLRVRGRAKSIERVALPADLAERLEFAHYYRVSVVTSDGHQAIICCRTAPVAWRGQPELDEPIEARGLFLKVGDASGELPQLVFAANRIGWLPDRVQESLGISADHVYLASLGMDIGLFDDVRTRNSKKVAREDRECFYQLLAAVGHAKPDDFRAHTATQFDLKPLFQAPSTQHGRLMRVKGVAWRVMRVRVEDADIRERFGIDHYFHIDLFIPLGNQKVVLGDKDSQSDERPTFVDRYPLTICTLNIPPDLQESADLRQEIVVSAAHFKLWSYRSQYVSSLDPGGRQVSPMMIGSQPQVVHFEQASNPMLALIIGLLFAAGLGVLWYLLWRNSRRDASFAKGVLSRQFEVPPGKSLNDGSVSAQDGPDFSNLD